MARAVPRAQELRAGPHRGPHPPGALAAERPEADDAQLLTAQAWALEDRPDEALGAFLAAAERRPRPEIAALALEGAAQIHARAGRLDKAIELYTQAMPGHPNPEALRTSIDMVRERREAAKTVTPGDRDAALDRNVRSRDQGDPDEDRPVAEALPEGPHPLPRRREQPGARLPQRGRRRRSSSPAAKGAQIFDVDGNDFVDYVGSWGPAILGHANAEVIREVDEQLKNGSSFGAPSPREIQLAELVRERAPWIEKMRFVSSGTEATTAAIRLARGFTGRDDILKFDGCYHGAGDPLLVKAGSGVETLGLPDSPGVPADVARHTLTLPYNDLPAVEKLLAERGAAIAAVIVEPVVGNMGVLVPKPGLPRRGSSTPAASTARCSSSTR